MDVSNVYFYLFFLFLFILRSKLRASEMPQAFCYHVIHNAYKQVCKLVRFNVTCFNCVPMDIVMT